MELRTLTSADIPQLKKIWKEIHHDTDPFLDWYFSERFFPQHSVCAEENGKIISVCHTMPTRQYLRGRVLPCALLNGVATLPASRGRGIMKQLIRFLYPILAQKGISLMPNTPVAFEIYAPCGHFPATDAVSLCAAKQEKLPQRIRRVPLSDALFPIYRKNAPRYSGIICRTEREFSRKMREYRLENAFALLHEEGYAICISQKDSVYCPECIASGTAVYEQLLQALYATAYPRRVEGKFPADALPQAPLRPRSVLGITNPRALIRQMQLDLPVTIALTDAFYPQNSGIYSLSDAPPAVRADVSLSVGDFAAWIAGYRNIEETDAVFHTDCAALFPKKQLCFTNDDY